MLCHVWAGLSLQQQYQNWRIQQQQSWQQHGEQDAPPIGHVLFLQCEKGHVVVVLVGQAGWICYYPNSKQGLVTLGLYTNSLNGNLNTLDWSESQKSRLQTVLGTKVQHKCTVPVLHCLLSRGEQCNSVSRQNLLGKAGSSLGELVSTPLLSVCGSRFRYEWTTLAPAIDKYTRVLKLGASLPDGSQAYIMLHYSQK
jgi:hypothetical protein